MTTTFCANCGVPLGTPFCSECGAPAPKPPTDLDATFVRSAPLVPASVEFPPPMNIPGLSDAASIAPEPTAVLPPQYGPPSVGTRASGRYRSRMWWVVGAAAAAIIGVTVAGFAVGGSSSTASPAAVFSTPPGASPSATSSGAPVASQEPGTRSALVPAWANQHIGRLVRAQMVLGASGTAVFASRGRNTCAVVGADVTCVATPLWHSRDAAALPAIDPACSSAQDGRWSVFTIGPDGAGTAVDCSSTPTALTLGTGTAPYNRVIGMGSTGILCYIDARRFANYDELQRYLDAMSPNEYERFRVAGRDYLTSEKFRQFSPDAFADRFIRDIEDHLRERGLAHLWR